MFWVSFFFTCVKREFLESRDRKKQRELQKHITYDLSQVESQTIDCDEVDGKSLPKIKSHCDRSTLKRFIIIWADIEVILMAAVLFFKHPEYDYAANFLKEICQHSWVCRGLIHKIICWKIVTSVLLRFGTKYECTLLALPWFVLNVSGIFPLYAVAASSFINYLEVGAIKDALVAIFRWISDPIS